MAPCGLVYYPGTGFGDSLKDTFLICDFRGGASNSGIRSFRLNPKGASYELVFEEQPIWTCLPTDLAFGPDGAMYVSDWVDGWNGLGKARIYRISSNDHGESQLVRQVHQILSGQWTEYSTDKLRGWLGHADRRVRLESQWELADRGEAALLTEIAEDATRSGIARLHALWGLGQIARREPTNRAIETAVVSTLSSSDPNLQSAAALIASEREWKSAIRPLQSLLTSAHPRVRYHGIDALGRLKDASILESVLKLISGGDTNDPAIRHAAALFLARAVEGQTIAGLASHPNVRVRLTAVVALGRKKSDKVADFLSDENPQVVLQAARTIHDLPLEFAAQDLAGLIKRPLDSDALARRVLNANFRIGTVETAAALAQFATRADAELEMRIEALEMLSEWGDPGKLDRVLGDYRPLEKREPGVAAAALDPQVDLLMAAPEKVRLKAIEVASILGIKKIAGQLAQQVEQRSRSDEARGKALAALARLNPQLAIKIASKIPVETRGALGLTAISVLATHDAAAHTSRFIAATAKADLPIRQKAWDILSTIQSPKAELAIENAVNDYLSGKLDEQVQLNVIEAARNRLSPELQSRLETHRQVLATNDPLADWIDCLAGGHPQRGKKLFFEKTVLSCVRCHKVDRAGGEVGPNLTVIGKERDARYLLEAICLPDAKIAKGYETAVIADLDGRVFTGIVRTETDDFVELIQADGSHQRIAVDDIDLRRKGKSSMPNDLTKHLTPRELRDLVAYLVTLKVDRRAKEDVE